MKELLEYIVGGILPGKDFTITEEADGDFVRLSIKVAPEDMGIIIGKAGATIKSIRNILRVRATLEKKGVSVDIAE